MLLTLCTRWVITRRILCGGIYMALNVGHYVWIPCEVKPGPFSDERVVRINSGSEEWVGYVPVSHLQDPILVGQTKVRALIVEVRQDRFSAEIPGEGITSRLYGDAISKAQTFDT